MKTTVRTAITVSTTIIMALVFVSVISAQTLVSGNISGTWTPAGNPYVVVDNSTVPSSQTLNINPGVTIIIGSNLNLTVNGTILAVGNATNRIAIRGPSEAVSYGNIWVNYSASPSRFEFCDFANAERALRFDITSHTGVQQATFKPLVANCTFSNIWRTAVRGEAVGRVHAPQYPGDGAFAENNHLDAVVVNCIFSSCNYGCALITSGTYYYQPFLDLYSYGYASPRIANNIFLNITNECVVVSSNYLSGYSTPLVMNNNFLSATYGIHAYDPFDFTIKNNIFVSNVTALSKVGTLSGTVGFNCFYRNQTNFAGYPGSFGQIVLNNRNGTPCDIAYDIFLDPLFAGSNDFDLATNSPCIDAGTPDWAYTDMCFPPSQGNSYADLGAYGGPDACNWLEVVPKLAVHPWMSLTNGVVWLNWDAIPRSAYQVWWVTNLTADTWLTSTNARLVAEQKLASGWVNTTNFPQRFFRVETLGGPTAQ
jgi:parallel beta-helix repeat protein